MIAIANRTSPAWLGLLFVLSFGHLAQAQTTPSDLRKLSRNPFADAITVPVEEDLYQGEGPFHREASSFTIEPLVPFPLGDSWLLVLRTAASMYSIAPDEAAPRGGDIGFGDISPTLFIGRSEVKRLVVGAGPTFLFPTATNGVGAGRWAMGPAGAVVFQPVWGSASLVVQDLRAVGGDRSRSPLHQFEMDVTVSRNLPGGWYVGSAPAITADWTQTVGQRWVVPLGVMAGRSGTIRRQAIDWNVGVYRLSIRPTDAPVWQAALQFTALYPRHAHHDAAVTHS